LYPLTDDAVEFEALLNRNSAVEDLQRLQQARAQPNPEAVKAIERLERCARESAPTKSSSLSLSSPVTGVSAPSRNLA
jgi:hypothetical protein